MPNAGKYLFTNVGFSANHRPVLSLQRDGDFFALDPLDQTLTIRFDTSRRYCIGWGDIATGDVFTCPDTNMLDPKYDQCPACQRRTGFNPAFYNATSVSEKQQARNQQPHILYLAHFGPGITKVGISYAGRGHRRLLEQGARSAIVLDTFPTALIARQYEARIASLPGIAETIQLRKKISALADFDHTTGVDELTNTKQRIEEALGTQFAGGKILSFDSHYFPSKTPDFADTLDISDQSLISGQVIGMVGSLLFCKYEDSLLFLPLKKFVGYPVTLSYQPTVVNVPARQISLF